MFAQGKMMYLWLDDSPVSNFKSTHQLDTLTGSLLLVLCDLSEE